MKASDIEIGSIYARQSWKRDEPILEIKTVTAIEGNVISWKGEMVAVRDDGTIQTIKLSGLVHVSYFAKWAQRRITP